MKKNGGIIGIANTPTKEVASGLWKIPEVYDARLNDIWPTNVTEYLIDSYVESNWSSGYNMYMTAYPSYGQTFACGRTANISKAKFYIYNGSGGGQITARLYAHTGTWGSSGKPTGAVLATSEIKECDDYSSEDTPTLVTFAFTGDEKYEMQSGTKYCICLYHELTTGNIKIGLDNVSSAHAGNQFYITGGSWVNESAAYDYIFYVYGEA